MSPPLRWLPALLLLLTQLTGQTIRIDAVPAYGSAGSIAGTVTGVDFASHRVAVYLYIEGSGWWTKPSAANPTVPIRADGTFTANVYTCCQDDRATIYCAALIPAGAAPPLASGSCRVPASLPSVAIDHVDRPGRTLQFAGRTWAVKQSPVPAGPGGNRFSDDPRDVFVDAQGQLHLRVVQRGGQWWSTEVVLLDDVGYGTYWFVTESQVGALDPNLTFGAFTWDPHCDDTTIPAWPNREIDFEDSRWGNPGEPNSSQVVVQPYWVAGNRIRYDTPPRTPPTLTRFFTWTATQIDFAAAYGVHSPGRLDPASVLHQSSYLHDPASGRRVPPEGRAQFRFNLWINQGGAPGNGQQAEVVISDFRYSRSVGAFPGGCGVNPAGSARVVSGAPVLGSTVTLGFDNPAGTQTPGALAALVVGAAPSRFPCGLLRLGMGMTAPVGELLVDPARQTFSALGSLWGGPGRPVLFGLAIPLQAALEGTSIYAQGVLLDPVGTVPIGLADAFELRIRS